MKTSRSGDIDGLVSNPKRFAILSALSGSERLSFGELHELVQTSVGNLSAHLRKLEDAGYVKADRHFEGRTPRRDFCITARGVEALNRYVEAMANVIAAMRVRRKKS
jgi:DNA-binding transcriptional ArsR family regulator